MIGEVRRLLDQRIDVDPLPIAAGAARVRQLLRPKEKAPVKDAFLTAAELLLTGI